MVANTRKPSVPGRHKTFESRKSIRTRKTPPKAPHNRPKRSQIRPGGSGSSSRSTVPTTRLAVTDLDIPPENRRLVICDGENICYNDITDQYLAVRLYEAVNWFLQQGFRVLMLCPDYLPRKLIGTEHQQVKIEYVPGIPDGTSKHSYNEALERILLRRANEEQAAIVSERQFQYTYNEAQEVVQTRVIGYTFFKSSIFIPVDPYGRAGPWLRVILRNSD
uniref:RNase NYN domain-containing protein n=1 Tax=Anopheles farauti TaxID=69004 RepID=A0A182QDA3_9DIPT